MIESMVIAWLDLPFWLAAPATLFFWSAIAAGLWCIFQHPRLVPFWHSCLGIVAPFFSSVAILFGISVGFMGADIWQRVEQSQQAVSREAGALNSLAYLAGAAGTVGQPVTAAVCAYAQAVVDQEWAEMAVNGEASPIAESRFSQIARPLMTPEFTAQVDTILRREMFSEFNQAREYRGNRLQLSYSHAHVGKWVMLLFLGFMTQVAIGLVHLDKRRAQALSLVVFTTAMAGTLILLAMMEWPFSPPSAVSSDPFSEIAGCHSPTALPNPPIPPQDQH